MKFERKKIGIISVIELKSWRVKALYMVLLVFMMIVALTCLLPPLWVMLSSFKTTAEFSQIPARLFPEHIDLSKIARVWKKTNFLRAYGATFIMILGDLAFTLVINGLAGYVLSRLKPKGSMLVFTVILWTMMVPNTMGMVPLYMTFVNLSMINTYLPMWLMAGANAFYILLFKGFFDSISISYIEAARIDGCSDAGIFARIIVPMSKPVIVTVSIFTINSAWGNFFWPYMVLKKNELAPVGLKIYQLQTQAIISIDEYMMSLMFVIIPAVLVFLIFQKYIMEGFTLGGIKG